MSLDNIQLPIQVITDLFKNSLVDLDGEQIKTTNKSNNTISFLGNNDKQIAILVNEPEAIYLKEDELNLLLNILNACKLTMADIAVINLDKTTTNYKQLQEDLLAKIILLIGVSTQDIALPLDFPMYKIQGYNNQQYISSVSLQQLLNDKAEKGKLWLSLKTLFSV
jgi:hypothetical protein